jgi:hypothetical protein
MHVFRLGVRELSGLAALIGAVVARLNPGA